MKTHKFCVEAKIKNQTGATFTEEACSDERFYESGFEADKAEETALKIKLIKANAGFTILDMQTKRFVTDCIIYGASSVSRDLKDPVRKCTTVEALPVYEKGWWDRMWDWVIK